jgi:hypothetical protein
MARRFGAASLSILPAPRLMGGPAGGPSCGATVDLDYDGPFTGISSSIGAHNHWDESQQDSDLVQNNQQIIGHEAARGTYANAGYGCSNTVKFDYSAPSVVGRIDSTITVAITWEPGSQPTYNCTSSNLDASCAGGELSRGYAAFTVSS